MGEKRGGAVERREKKEKEKRRYVKNIRCQGGEGGERKKGEGRKDQQWNENGWI